MVRKWSTGPISLSYTTPESFWGTWVLLLTCFGLVAARTGVVLTRACQLGGDLRRPALAQVDAHALAVLLATLP
jgi:hypothetical protein